MKRFKNSTIPKPKQSFKWKLKAGITWETIDMLEMTDEILEKYFDKVEE